MPEGAEPGILKGMYLFSESPAKDPKARVQLLGSGTILREVIAGAELLEKDYGVACDVWSATSFNLLRRDGLECSRSNAAAGTCCIRNQSAARPMSRSA
jgi:pyruvate dehydrogenase E1 component